MPGETRGTRLWGLKGHWRKPIILPLPNGTQKGGPASTSHFLREGAAHRDQHRPRPASPQQLGFRKGVSISLRISGCPSFRGRFSSFFRGKETREKPMDELLWRRRGIILTLFQNSFKGWKGKFFKIRATKHDPTALDGFPLY